MLCLSSKKGVLRCNCFNFIFVRVGFRIIFVAGFRQSCFVAAVLKKQFCTSLVDCAVSSHVSSLTLLREHGPITNEQTIPLLRNRAAMIG